jgi:hypothetical protein
MSTRLHAIRAAAAFTSLFSLFSLYLFMASPGEAMNMITLPQYRNYCERVLPCLRTWPELLAYGGDDYPELWEISSTQTVGMMVEETRSNSKGFGYVRLGSEHSVQGIFRSSFIHISGFGGHFKANISGTQGFFILIFTLRPEKIKLLPCVIHVARTRMNFFSS